MWFIVEICDAFSCSTVMVVRNIQMSCFSAKNPEVHLASWKALPGPRKMKMFSMRFRGHKFPCVPREHSLPRSFCCELINRQYRETGSKSAASEQHHLCQKIVQYQYGISTAPAPERTVNLYAVIKRNLHRKKMKTVKSWHSR